MMFSSSRPPITQNQIPTVKKLCEDLGFGHPFDRPESYLKESTQSWRKQYKTREGVLGKSLVEWRQQKTQIDLKSMTIDFLEKGGYGGKHWPANSVGILEYPKDRHRIIELLMQLFWKENNNEAHNAKHPDRGRRVRESIESDQSSTTLTSPTIPAYPRSKHPSAQAPRQSGLKPAYAGIGVGSIPKGPFINALRRPDLTLNKENTPEGQHAASPTQSSGSLFVPSTAETEELSAALQSSLPTLIGSSSESVDPNIPDDVYDWCDDDLKRSAKDIASKRITSSFRHPWKCSEDGGTATGVAPVANMRTSPAAPKRTPKKTRAERTTPPSKPAGAQALHGRSSAESNRRRRRDADVDNDDTEYIPLPRSKRHKATSNASDDAPTALEPHPPAPETEASPTRTSPPAADEECPICFTVLSQIADGSIAARESHVDTCINVKLSSSPSAPAPEIRKSNPVLPNRPRGKLQIPATLVAPSVDNGLSVPESPLVEVGHEDLIDNAQEYLRRSSAEPSHELHQPLADQDVDHAERSLPSPASNPALPDTTTPEPPPPPETPNQPQNPAQPPQALPPKPEINYYIIPSRHPRLTKIHWPEGSLADKTLDAIFAEVSAIASKKDVQRIAFKLTTSKSELQYTITRADGKIYEIMKKAFSKDVNRDLARGNREFDVEVEVDPGRSGISVETEECGVDFGFSF